jgi:aminotransferase
MPKKDLEIIADLAKRHDLLVLSDEAYEKLVYDDIQHYSIASIEGMKERTVSIFSFSKTYSMTGWRIGFLAAEQELVKLLTKAQEHHVACAPAISQRAALAALEGSQVSVKKMVEEYQRRRDFLCQSLNQMENVRCLEPKGTFYAFLNISETGFTSKEMARRILHDAKVVTVPGAAFGKYGDEHIRLSFATDFNQLKTASERLYDYFEGL